MKKQEQFKSRKTSNMKQNIFLMVFISLLSSISSIAQNNNFTKDIIPNSPEASHTNQLIRNPNATSIIVQGVTIDKKITKYYNPGDLEAKNLSKEDAIKLNHTYLDSYELLNKSQLSSSCLNKINSNFDLGSYSHLRKQNERTIVPIVFDGCTFNISLFSWNEVNNIKQ